MPTDGDRSPRRGALAGAPAASASSDAECHPDLASLFADFSRAQDEELAAFEPKQVSEHHKVRSDFKTDLATFVGRLDKDYQKRFDRLDLEQADMRKEVTSLRSQMQHMSAWVCALCETLQAASQATPPYVAIGNDDFNRDPIDAIVRTRTQTGAMAATLLDPFKELLAEKRLDPFACQWGAQPLGRAGTLRSSSSHEFARLRAREFVSILKDKVGRGRRLQVATATGELCPAYTDIDKNRALHTRGDGPRSEHAGQRRRQRDWDRILAAIDEVCVDDYSYCDLAVYSLSKLDKLFVFRFAGGGESRALPSTTR